MDNNDLGQKRCWMTYPFYKYIFPLYWNDVLCLARRFRILGTNGDIHRLHIQIYLLTMWDPEQPTFLCRLLCRGEYTLVQRGSCERNKRPSIGIRQGMPSLARLWISITSAQRDNIPANPLL